LEDDLGLPTLFAVTRASKFLAKKGAANDVSLIVTGGLVTPGDYLKAMALGADAVYIGTIAMISMVGDQMTKTLPFEPPTDLVVYNAKMTDKLDIDRSATNLFNFLNASVREMELICYTTGKTNLSDISKSDLCTLDPFLSRATGVDLGYISHEEQKNYFEGFSQFPFVHLPDESPTDQNEQTVH
jgi:glutamate synthase domain-containing protein 2